MLMEILGRMTLLRITNRSAHCYPKLIHLGCIAVRRKRAESLADMLIRLAVRVQPFDREFSREEVQLLYARDSVGSDHTAQ